jgi:ATP-dependent RNA circularization protein (DNA/RNA ligase family)
MFRKYEKTFRIDTQRYHVPGKLVLSHDDQRALLTGKVEITEKVDGANTGIVRGKGDKWILQKRRGLADTGVHEQFAFFWAWGRANEQKILQIPHNWIVYGELTYSKHHIYYDVLPSYFLVFDVWNGKQFIDHDDRLALCDKLQLKHVPVLHYGYVADLHELESFVGKSRFSTELTAEGIFVKNYRKQMKGKLVRPEFVKDLEDEDHWMKQALRRNSLAPGANTFD